MLGSGILVVAAMAATLGLWSPCGLSMVSTITPLGERGRGNRYRVTATWYVIGAILGGATVGAVVAVPATLAVPSRLAAALVAGLALVAMCSDSRVFGGELPIHRRQVNERWLDRYRGWVYGVGFGWQIGTGIGTYVMSAATYLLLLAPALLSPRLAIGAWLTFGCMRGLTVLATRRVRSTQELQALHLRLHAVGSAVRRCLVAAEGLLVVAAAASLGLVAAATAAIAVAVVWAASHQRRHDPVCTLRAPIGAAELVH
jgi:MFS family permease